jgi:outer membrane protein
MRYTLIMIIVTMLCSSVLSAYETVNLQQSIEIALESNKELEAERNSLQAAQWRQHNALTNFFPKAYLNASVVRIDDQTYEDANTLYKIPVFGSNDLPTGDYVPFSMGAMNGLYKTTYRSGITVQQPVFTGGKIAGGYQLAKLGKQQAMHAFNNKELVLSARIATLYFNILKLQSLQELNELSIASARSNMERVEQMQQAGIARRSDWLQWRVKLQDELTTKLEIENNLTSLLEIWNLALGFSELRYSPEPIAKEGYKQEITFYAELTDQDYLLEQTVQQVKENNPILQITKTNRKMVRQQHRMTKGDFLPTLNLQFSYEFENDDRLDFSGDRNWNIAAVLSFPIFTGGGNYTNLRRSHYEQRYTELATEYNDQMIVLEAQRIQRDLITKAQSIESNKLALEFARENYSTMQSLHEQGLITSRDLLDAETMLYASEMNYAASFYDFISTRFELTQYTGFQEDQ